MSQVQTTDLQNIYQAVSGQLLPRSKEVNKHVKQFLQGELADFEKWNKSSDTTLDKLRTEENKYNKITGQIKQKMNKDGKFKEGADNFLKAKDDEIHAKNKNLESINTGLKECVTKIIPEKLAKLPYDKDNIYEEIFTTLFQVLYHKPRDQYNWKDFKNLGLLKDDGEDFITRMANINFRQMSQQHYDALRMLNGLEKFKDISENSAHAVDIVDLADWLLYVIEGHKIMLQKKQCEHEYDKIRKDLDVRMGGGLSVKEQFCKETLKEIELYQSSLMNYQAQLRTLMVGMKSGIDEIVDIQVRRKERIQKINIL